jgi:hypothetical protein
LCKDILKAIFAHAIVMAMLLDSPLIGIGKYYPSTIGILVSTKELIK